MSKTATICVSPCHWCLGGSGTTRTPKLPANKHGSCKRFFSPQGRGRDYQPQSTRRVAATCCAVTQFVSTRMVCFRQTCHASPSDEDQTLCTAWSISRATPPPYNHSFPCRHVHWAAQREHTWVSVVRPAFRRRLRLRHSPGALPMHTHKSQVASGDNGRGRDKLGTAASVLVSLETSQLWARGRKPGWTDVCVSCQGKTQGRQTAGRQCIT